LSIGLTISVDYWWSLFGLEEGTEEYKEAIHPLHQRAADRILDGCLRNGGLYIKLGQGLVCLNHILPNEYFETLKVSFAVYCVACLTSSEQWLRILIIV
jgi:aarF domain-containing kinase